MPSGATYNPAERLELFMTRQQRDLLRVLQAGQQVTLNGGKGTIDGVTVPRLKVVVDNLIESGLVAQDGIHIILTDAGRNLDTSAIGDHAQNRHTEKPEYKGRFALSSNPAEAKRQQEALKRIAAPYGSLSEMIRRIADGELIISPKK